MVRWRAYYTEGREFDSTDDDWSDLPSDGVLAVNVYLERPVKQTIYGYDWYFHIPDTDVFGGDDHGDVTERYPGAIIKRGKWISYDDWIDFQSHVKADRWDK